MLARTKIKPERFNFSGDSNPALRIEEAKKAAASETAPTGQIKSRVGLFSGEIAKQTMTEDEIREREERERMEREKAEEEERLAEEEERKRKDEFKAKSKMFDAAA